MQSSELDYPELHMNFDKYAELAMRTLSLDSSRDHDSMLATTALGLAGESGEINEMIKKYFFHGEGHDIDPKKFAKELGDILWYVACGCKTIGISMGEVAHMNITKLKNRYPEKFEANLSLNKNEDKE